MSHRQSNQLFVLFSMTNIFGTIRSYMSEFFWWTRYIVRFETIVAAALERGGFTSSLTMTTEKFSTKSHEPIQSIHHLQHCVMLLRGRVSAPNVIVSTAS